MSQIEELVERLCPDGVTHVSLGNVVAYSTTTIDASELTETTFVGVDNLLPNKAGKTTARHGPNTARVTQFQEGDVLLGNIRPYLRKIWLADHSGGCSGDVLCIRIHDTSEISPGFLFQVLGSESFFRFFTKHSRGAKMPRGDKKEVLKYVRPVPPLEVQHEIVKILDTFTDLESELESELEARRLQFRFYQEKILLPCDDTPWTTLSDIADIGTGNRNTNEASSTGTYPFFVRSQEPLLSNSYQFDETAIITAGDGVGVGRVFHFVRGKYALHQRAYRISPQSELVEPKFLFYWIRFDFPRYLTTTSVHASVTSLRRPMFLNYRVPLPPLPAQRQIIHILDTFDALVNNLTSGLPAELNARRQQYEYYRDKLLTFKELKS